MAQVLKASLHMPLVLNPLSAHTGAGFDDTTGTLRLTHMFDTEGPSKGRRHVMKQ